MSYHSVYENIPVFSVFIYEEITVSRSIGTTIPQLRIDSVEPVHVPSGSHYRVPNRVITVFEMIGRIEQVIFALLL